MSKYYFKEAVKCNLLESYIDAILIICFVYVFNKFLKFCALFHVVVV